MVLLEFTVIDVVESLVVLFFWFMLIWMFIAVFADVFRRERALLSSVAAGVSRPGGFDVSIRRRSRRSPVASSRRSLSCTPSAQAD